MDELNKTGKSGLVSLLHGKNGEISIPKPFERDIFLFDTYVAGTSHIEGMEELELVTGWISSESPIISMMPRRL